MLQSLIFALAAALVSVAVALAREVRIRRTLERIIAVLLDRLGRRDEQREKNSINDNLPNSVGSSRLPRPVDGDRPRGG
ncbi:hypothetical protein PLANPX_4839 [Lacipirellula parvula]|uniref:Uncharacterized protein n=1 Tax=Lacipirellula parvula TaxID=2650471 RepID=A0A5K7XGV5_9BACT|nr:hypothetical protein PLANPX_4839 [Lacipirellula parvula]